MKLSSDSIQNLEALLSAASLVKIDNVVIVDGSIRGIDDDKSVVVISDTNVPDFGTLKIGLNRLSDLSKRMSLVKNYDDFEVTTEEAPKRPGYVSHLKLSSKKAKIQFRTANPDNIKAPKSLNDTENWLVMVPKDDVAPIVQAASTMGSEEIILTRKPNGEVFFEFLDNTTQDSLSHQFSDEAQYIPPGKPDNETFVHYYRVKSFLPLLRSAGQHGDVALIVGEKGMLWITVNGYSFTIIPRIGNR